VDVDPHRDETEAERYDRNWIELLQELRVAQTGVQILAALLLTLPFTSRFPELSTGYRVLYLVAFVTACLTVALFITPVATHRLFFGRGEKDLLVHVSALVAQLGLASLALTVVCVVVLIFGIVLGTLAGVVAGAGMSAFFVLFWYVVPLVLRRRPLSDRFID
jgi:hypothetical protein